MNPPNAGLAQLDPAAAPPRLRISGDWTLPHYAALETTIAALGGPLEASARVDLDELGALDTAGASLLVQLLGTHRLERLDELAPRLPPARRALLETVGHALCDYCKPPKPKPRTSLILVLERIGIAIEEVWKKTVKLLGFTGLVLETLARGLFRPSRWRLTPLVAHVEQTGLDAMPIVALLTFMVGAVVAFLGSTVLKQFGAVYYTVDLLGYAFLREFGVLLAAILLAGRTASSFTAQIGSMKANQEIDAIRTLGLDPVELLVLPRVLALLVSLPMLSFIAVLAGLFGGGLVCALLLGISPSLFLSLLKSDLGLRHFVVGIVKAPVFAFLIAVIGCLEGFKVSGSAQSVGEHTTSSVVQSIFVVILLDAVAALFFMEMGW